MTCLTDREAAAIAHALGVPIKRRGRSARASRWAYRNYFAAGAEDAALWHGLAARGLAIQLRADPQLCADALFSVTRAGVQAAGLAAYVPAKLVKA